MPNHFHWMMVVREVTVEVPATATVGVAQSDTDGKGQAKHRTLNDSIGILLRSYTNAINKQEYRSGKLFREATKAECLNCCQGITPSFFNTQYGTLINTSLPENQYPQRCFDYIHNNPVKAGLVKRAEDWEFSSYRDYFLNRNGTLINKKAAKEFGIIIIAR
jgi:putative transposase